MLEIHELCSKCDIVLLQETWLLECEHSILSSISNEFYSKGISAVDINHKVLSGRPHGGIAILWKKTLGKCKITDFSDNRMMVFELQCGEKSLLFVNVYMPCCSEDNYPDFLYYLGKINSIVTDSNSPYVYVLGDYNANICKPETERSHTFGIELKEFCLNEGLVLSDVLFCDDNSYTFYSEAHHSVSWLDHIVCSASAHNLIENVWVDYSKVSSDHHPLLASINLSDIVHNDELSDNNSKNHSNIVKWDRLSSDDILSYRHITENTLSSVEINHDMILCDNPTCTNQTHKNAIERMYCDITSALCDAGQCFSTKNKCNQDFNQILGWNDYCKVAHEQARESYLLWRDSGRNKQGLLFEAMKKSRAYFKHVFRQCKSADSNKSADALANKLLHKDDKQFWKEIKKINNDKFSVATSINSVTGCKNITNMWKTHFESVLNSSVDTSNKCHVLNTLRSSDMTFVRFSNVDVLNAIKSLKNGKSTGLDNLHSEHFKYAHGKVAVLLAIVFNAMIIHDFLPSSLLDSIIVSLLKDKQGNITDHNNYRPLAISCAASKIFEFLILHRYKHLLTTSANQFGFKENLSTEMCIFSLKQVIDYYNTYNSPVYICYLDASKAFDKINHWHLFAKLLDKNLPSIIV
jgi:exonuclease III